MSTRPARILCTGDVHLGRVPSRAPTQPALTVRAVWSDLVETAIRQQVDAVVITGDVVDEDNKTYEALGPVQRGLQRLGDASIPVIAVAGNHDYDALPRLAGMVEASGFHLLGRGGQWETMTLEPEDATPVQFAGWSFPSRHVAASPLDTLPPDLFDDGVPGVGVLHADLDAPDSRYAPVTLGALRETTAVAWLLGHIHAPGVRHEAAPLVLYPGSPQPLRPQETGSHGPWVVTIAPDAPAEARHHPRATLRYQPVEVDLSDATERDDVDAATTDAIRTCLSETDETHLEHVVCRLRLTGRTDVHRHLPEWTSSWTDELVVPVGETTASVDGVDLETRPDLDLDALADGSTPPAVLARLILALDDDAAEPDPLVRDVWAELDDALAKVRRSPAYAPLRGDDALSPTRDTLRSDLKRQGLLLLDELLAQR